MICIIIEIAIIIEIEVIIEIEIHRNSMIIIPHQHSPSPLDPPNTSGTDKGVASIFRLMKVSPSPWITELTQNCRSGSRRISASVGKAE